MSKPLNRNFYPPGFEQKRATIYQGVSAASAPRWLSYDMEVAGVTVTEKTAMSASAVFACVRNIGEDIGKLPLVTYRRVGESGKERARNHPLYRILHDEPNPEMSPIDFRQAVTSCAVLFGRGYAEVERNNDQSVRHLWPLESWRVETKRDKDGTMFYLVDGVNRIEARNVLHIRGFTLDGIVGEMVASVGRESLGLTLAAQKFAAKFFGGGARPSGVLEHPGKLGPQAAKNLRASWDEKYSGVENSHGTIVLEEGMKWTSVSTQPNEAQMIETRQFQVEDVARWFRMPPHKIQHLLRSTFSNIEHQAIEYVQDTLMPWLVRWEQEAARKLFVGESEYFAEHLVDALMRGDMASRYNAHNVAIQGGWKTRNEAREAENLNPLPGLDDPLSPLNMTSVSNQQVTQ